MSISLAELPVGASARVAGIEGEDVLSRRLKDLGFWQGARVAAIRRAPLGDPTQYRLHGYRLALRRTEASRVSVEPEP